MQAAARYSPFTPILSPATSTTATKATAASFQKSERFLRPGSPSGRITCTAMARMIKNEKALVIARGLEERDLFVTSGRLDRPKGTLGSAIAALRKNVTAMNVVSELSPTLPQLNSTT
jgi:hypothetical protein